MGDADGECGSFKVGAGSTPFERLAELTIWCPANRIDNRVPVRILFDVGQHSFDIKVKPRALDKIYKKFASRKQETTVELVVNLRYCFIYYYTKGIKVLPQEKFRQKAPGLVIKAVETQTNKRQAGTAWRAGAEAKAAAHSGLYGGGIKAGGQAGRSRSVSRAEETTVERNSDIYLIDVVPHGWRVGDPEMGDPSQGNLLRGRYFDLEHTQQSCTFEAEFEDGCQKASITFAVEAREGICIRRSNMTGSLTDERVAAMAAMRDRIAAIRIEKSLRESHPPENEREFILLRRTCEITRAVSPTPLDTS